MPPEAARSPLGFVPKYSAKPHYGGRQQPDRERGKRVAHARLSAGLTQEELAEAVGAEQPTVSRWEKPGQMPAADLLLKLAAVTNVSPEWLVFGPEAPGYTMPRAPEEPPYEAWQAFLETPEAKAARAVDELAVAQLGQLRWPEPPTVGTYLAFLAVSPIRRRRG